MCVRECVHFRKTTGGPPVLIYSALNAAAKSETVSDVLCASEALTSTHIILQLIFHTQIKPPLG